jgi:hypothetical protein
LDLATGIRTRPLFEKAFHPVAEALLRVLPFQFVLFLQRRRKRNQTGVELLAIGTLSKMQRDCVGFFSRRSVFCEGAQAFHIRATVISHRSVLRHPGRKPFQEVLFAPTSHFS